MIEKFKKAESKEIIPLESAVHIPNLPKHITKEELTLLLSQKGEIISLNFREEKDLKMASVLFKDESTSENLIKKMPRPLYYQEKVIEVFPLSSTLEMKYLIHDFKRRTYVFLHNIPEKMTDNILFNIFKEEFGEIKELNVSKNSGRKYARLRFKNKISGYRMLVKRKVQVFGYFDQKEIFPFIYIEKSALKSNTDFEFLEGKKEDGGKEVEDILMKLKEEREKELRYEICLKKIHDNSREIDNYVVDDFKFRQFFQKKLSVFLLFEILNNVGYIEIGNDGNYVQYLKKLSGFKGNFGLVERVNSNHIPSNLRFRW